MATLGAQYRLTLAYENGGLGVAINFEVAFTWYEKAAEGGDGHAQCRLGYADKDGDFDLVINLEAAFTCFQKSAEERPMSADLPGWISGYVALPLKAIKDAEGVSVCSQLFFVAECQGNSLEVAVALPKDKRVRFDGATAQRFLLSAGDQFFVPPHNVYRLENHSTLKEAKLFCAIIKVFKPHAPAATPCALALVREWGLLRRVCFPLMHFLCPLALCPQPAEVESAAEKSDDDE